jgi:hypothetical protein
MKLATLLGLAVLVDASPLLAQCNKTGWCLSGTAALGGEQVSNYIKPLGGPYNRRVFLNRISDSEIVLEFAIDCNRWLISSIDPVSPWRPIMPGSIAESSARVVC